MELCNRVKVKLCITILTNLPITNFVYVITSEYESSSFLLVKKLDLACSSL